MTSGTVYLLVLVALFVGVVVWAFGRKRKKRFEDDAKIPFRDSKR
jgi:cytochrome c oxidase cbb3-type subunit 4